MVLTAANTATTLASFQPHISKWWWRGAIFRLARQRRDLYRATAHHSVNKPTARQAAEEAVRLWREEQT